MTVDELSPFAVFEQKAAIPATTGTVPRPAALAAKSPPATRRSNRCPARRSPPAGDSAAAAAPSRWR